MNRTSRRMSRAIHLEGLYIEATVVEMSKMDYVAIQVIFDIYQRSSSARPRFLCRTGRKIHDRSGTLEPLDWFFGKHQDWSFLTEGVSREKFCEAMMAELSSQLGDSRLTQKKGGSD